MLLYCTDSRPVSDPVCSRPGDHAEHDGAVGSWFQLARQTNAHSAVVDGTVGLYLSQSQKQEEKQNNEAAAAAGSDCNFMFHLFPEVNCLCGPSSGLDSSHLVVTGVDVKASEGSFGFVHDGDQVAER